MEKIKCKNCGAEGEVSFGTCRVCTPKEILKARLEITTERLAATEDFKILTAQLKDQYIVLRIAPLVDHYNSLVDQHADQIANELEEIAKAALKERAEDPEEEEIACTYNLNMHENN